MPLHGIDHATTIRAIADIWFPRQQQLLLDRGAAFSSMTANVESSPRDKSQNRPDNAKPGCRENRRKLARLSIEIKVATGFVLMVVGAMAQG
jgi:hypothetical protein